MQMADATRLRTATALEPEPALVRIRRLEGDASWPRPIVPTTYISVVQRQFVLYALQIWGRRIALLEGPIAGTQ